MIRHTLFLSTCLLALLLTGCGARWATQTVSFDRYELEITEGYREVSAGLVENKQILNKILKSFKSTDEWIFADNLIITKSVLELELDYEQYRTANSSKLRQYLAGYLPGEQTMRSFDCQWEKVKGVYVTFEVKDTSYDGIDTYYISQYQFVDQGYGYIISAASADADNSDLLDQRLDTLNCPQTRS